MIKPLLILFAILLSNSVYGIKAKSTVILLSVDGFSFNYLQRYQPKNLLSFAESGVITRLLPVYPSKTFPNHLSIITGTYPVNHGVIHNKFYNPQLDKKYYLGAGKTNVTWLTASPLWSVVEDNSIKSAVYFWPESEVIGHSPPSYNHPYNKNISNKDRVEQLIAWLKLPESQRPYFIVSYFSTVDSAGHHYGLDSPQLVTAIDEFDKLFGTFIERIKNEINQPVNIVLVSDHGMMPITKQASILTNSAFKNINLKLDGVTVTYSDTQLFVYLNKNKLTNQTRINIENKLQSNRLDNDKRYTIYTKHNYPKHWYLNVDLSIVPDIILEAIPPATFIRNKKATSFDSATHGFDSKGNENLHGVFIASGPNVKQGRVLEPFKNIHVFPFMKTLLGLKENKEIDGKKSVLVSIIK